MALPTPETPLYNHPLPAIEEWLKNQGCEQDPKELHAWRIHTDTWQAELSLEVDQLTVRYVKAGEGYRDIQRSFKYSLSREDIEAAVFSGP